MTGTTAPAPPAADAIAGLVAELRASLPAGGVLTGGDIPERHSHDWSGLPPLPPALLVRPRSTAEVATTLAAATRFRVPVVTQGGLTGLAGGAHPLPGSLALSLELMSGVEDIDPIGSTMTVLAGTPLAVAEAAAEAQGLHYPVDLGARGTCTIGGNIATNAGGIRVIRYGMTRDNVLGLEVVLADGTVVDAMNRLVKNNSGYDVKQLMIGAEGTLGVVTRAVLRLVPRPAATATAFCGVRDFAGVTALLAAARRTLGPGLTAFEAMWPCFFDTMHAGCPALRRPLAGRHGLYVIVEASGAGEEEARGRLEVCLGECMEDGSIEDAVLAASERETRDFWGVRESVSEYGRVLGDIIAFDVGVPIPRMGDLVAEVHSEIEAGWPDARILCYGHVGDSNLHVVVNVPSAGRHQPHAEIDAIVYGRVAALRGTVSAEHGIGTLKSPFLALTRTAGELETMRRIKAALDPAGILNPGKVLG